MGRCWKDTDRGDVLCRKPVHISHEPAPYLPQPQHRGPNRGPACATNINGYYTLKNQFVPRRECSFR